MRRLSLAALTAVAALSGAAVTADTPTPTQATQQQGPTVREAAPATRGTQQQAPTATARVSARAQRAYRRTATVRFGGPRGAWIIRKPRRGSAYVAFRG